MFTVKLADFLFDDFIQSEKHFFSIIIIIDSGWTSVAKFGGVSVEKLDTKLVTNKNPI